MACSRGKFAGDLRQQITRHRGEAELDLSAELDRFAEEADKDPESYRWSFSRDFGDTRLIVVDSRAARNLKPEERALLDKV
ncbi:MAG: glycoside hydrolase, partial [Arthrobacter sp.]|nr:glycoside hydrolase [Arthrobacter sp.]